MSAPQPTRPGAGLLERLMQAVRPEFRSGEEFYPPRDSPVFFQGTCRVASCQRALSYSVKRLCTYHYERWQRAGYPELEPWLAAEDVAYRQREPPPGCGIAGCKRASHGPRPLCCRHTDAWQRAGSPDLAEWLASARYTPPPHPERDCVVASCRWWTDGPGMVLCRRHYTRWRNNGHPELPADQLTGWFRVLDLRRDPYIRLHDLGAQLRLEIQYGLQCRYDQGNRHTAPRIVTRALSWVRAAGVNSLLDWDQTQWRDFCQPKRSGYSGLARGFIQDTRFALCGLLIADDPWADQYPRDTWELHHLGLAGEQCSRLHFEGIPQPWLKELAKRWCRWRLTRNVDPGTVKVNLNALTRLARHLADIDGKDAGPAALTRARIETWLAALQVQVPVIATRSHQVGSVGVFLRDVHRHGWQPDLPRGAFIYTDDSPRQHTRKPRFIPEHLMRQLETPDALAKFPSDDGRLLLELIMACGLRIKDARWLPFDCVVRDDNANPYLAWLNRKIGDRPAFFPLSDALAGKIAAQQRAVRKRFPNGSMWLFPAVTNNVDGSRPVSDKRLREHLAIWLERLSLTDEHDRPVKVTFHQFRHTLATRLINADVPQPVVQALLDHMSPAMVACAGINRHGEGDERALHRRSSDPRWPQVMRWRL